MKIKTSICLWFFVLCQLSLLAQEQLTESIDLVPKVSEEIYKDISGEIDFSKTKRALKPKEREKTKKRKSPNLNFSIGPIIQILCYALIICLVAFLLYFIFSKIDIDKKINRSKIDLPEVENIKDLDTVSLLQQALNQQDYRSAIRIQFLDLLKTLSIDERIQWKSDKTNNDYARELRNDPIKGKFKNLVNIFDHVWYGEKQISQSQYQLIEKEFNSCKNLKL